MESGNGGASSKGDEPFPPPAPLIRLSLQDLKKKVVWWEIFLLLYSTPANVMC